MNGLNALGKGLLASLRAIKVSAWLYVVNVFLALIVASAFRNAVMSGIGNSMALDTMLRGFDYTTYADFLNVHGDAVKSLFPQFTWGIIITLFLNTVLGGGIVTAVTSARAISLKEFLAASGEFFNRMLRLFLISGVVAGLMLTLVTMILGIIYSTVDATATSEKTVVINFIGGIILLAIPMGLTLMFADYARVYLVVENERSAFRAYWQGIRILFRNFFSAWVVQLGTFALVLAVIATYWFFEARFTAHSRSTIAVLFIVQQVFILSRLWMRLWNVGSVAVLVNLPQDSVSAVPQVQIAGEVKHEAPIASPEPSNVIRETRPSSPKKRRAPATPVKARSVRAKKSTMKRRK